MRAKNTTRKPDYSKIGHNWEPRFIKTPDGHYTVGYVPVSNAGEILDVPIDEGVNIGATGSDRRELFKLLHDQIDAILEQEPVEAE